MDPSAWTDARGMDSNETGPGTVRVNLDTVTPWTILSVFPATQKTAAALMRDDAPTWSDEDHVGYLRIDLASTDRANHAQFMILLAGVLFGIGGGVIATWVTQFGNSEPDRKAGLSYTQDNPAGREGIAQKRPEASKLEPLATSHGARPKRQLPKIVIAILAIAIGWRAFNRKR
jgi:hypothetical protein